MKVVHSPRVLPVAIGILFAFTSLAGGCDCSSNPGLEPVPDWVCVDHGGAPRPDDSPCPNGGRFVLGACMELRCDAYEEEGKNCCPGMICLQTGECVVPPGRIETCTTNGDCEVAGHECFERPEVSIASKTCGPRPQNAGGGCDNGATPFNDRCIRVTPCQGACPAGKICNIDTNSCESPPVFATNPSCHQSCETSTLLVYSDPDAMLFDSCCEATCTCLTLPPLSPGVFGRFSDLAVDGAQVLLSSYDSTYGDLVVSSHNPGSGIRDELTYVDGFPQSGTPVADPNGPRSGLDEPGPNRGQHTSIALHKGAPRVAYYDVDTQDLKFARYDASAQSWDITAIHTGPADVGRYTSLIIDEDGIAHVAYYAHRISRALEEGQEPQITTGPFYARARSSKPSGPADWDILPIEVVPSCHGACTTAEACVEIDHAPVCQPLVSECDSCQAHQACVGTAEAPRCEKLLPDHLEVPCGDRCAEGETCVLQDTGASVCATPVEEGCGTCAEETACMDTGADSPSCLPESTYPEHGDLPEGVGLFTSLALFKGTPIVSYYDRTRSHLRGAAAQFIYDGDTAPGFVSTPLVSVPDQDVGQQSRLAVNPDGTGFAVSYQALGGETLWLYSAEDMLNFSGETELVDNGQRTTSINLVGASSSPAYNAQGDLFIAYADQTNNDLVLAARNGDSWIHTNVLSNGAVGSFTNLVIHDNIGHISTYMRMRDSTDRDISELKVVILDLSAPEGASNIP